MESTITSNFLNMAGIYIQSGIHPAITGHGDLAYFGLDSKSEGWKRLDEHYKDLKRGVHHNKSIQDFHNEFGIDQIYRGIIIECDEYYLNTLEKAYIFHGNSNRKFNPEGWNGSGGGEGSTRHDIRYSFVHGDTLHTGDNLLLFMKTHKEIDPGGFIQLLDGRLKTYEGFSVF